MARVNFECYEDSGGGLYLFIMKNGKPIEMFDGFEYCGANALLSAFSDIEDYKHWDNALTEKIANQTVPFTSVQQVYEQMQQTGTNLIADICSETGAVQIYYDNLCKSARAALTDLMCGKPTSFRCGMDSPR